MAELEQQLTQMLQNPQIMQQVMAMAQAFGMDPPKQAEAPKQDPKPDPKSIPNPDTLRRLSQFASLPMLDQKQKGLLKGLAPYLSAEKSKKLENAMTIAHLATMASSMFPGNATEVK